VQKVVRAIEAASFVMLELSKTRDDADKQLLHAAATAFVTQVQVRDCCASATLLALLGLRAVWWHQGHLLENITP